MHVGHLRTFQGATNRGMKLFDQVSKQGAKLSSKVWNRFQRTLAICTVSGGNMRRSSSFRFQNRMQSSGFKNYQNRMQSLVVSGTGPSAHWSSAGIRGGANREMKLFDQDSKQGSKLWDRFQRTLVICGLQGGGGAANMGMQLFHDEG